MATADELDSLIKRINVEFDDWHNFYEHTRSVWRTFQKWVDMIYAAIKLLAVKTQDSEIPVTNDVESVKVTILRNEFFTSSPPMLRPKRRGLSLIEVIVIIIIVIVLLGFLFPATRNIRGAADRAKCANNLKQIMLALHTFESTGTLDCPGKGFFPTGCIGPGETPEERLSWMVALLPYVEQNSLYEKLDLEKGYAWNLPELKSSLPQAFRCPASKELNGENPVTNYIAMSGIGLDAAYQETATPGNGFMGYDRLTSLAMIEDGTSNTIALMETRSDLGPWAHGGPSNLRGFDPVDLPLFGDQRPFGGHANGMLAAMADGSTRFISSSIDPKQLAAAITVDGGEDVNLDGG